MAATGPASIDALELSVSWAASLASCSSGTRACSWLFGDQRVGCVSWARWPHERSAEAEGLAPQGEPGSDALGNHLDTDECPRLGVAGATAEADGFVRPG